MHAIKSLPLLFALFLTCFGCAFEPTEAADPQPDPAAETEAPAGTLEQALQGCGVDMRNSWATSANGGVWVTGWLQNYGTANCPIRWQFEVVSNAVSYFSAVYPQPSGWFNVAPGVTVKSTVFMSNIPGPCGFRTWIKMGSTWYHDSWMNCF